MNVAILLASLLFTLAHSWTEPLERVTEDRLGVGEAASHLASTMEPGDDEDENKIVPNKTSASCKLSLTPPPKLFSPQPAGWTEIGWTAKIPLNEKKNFEMRQAERANTTMRIMLPMNAIMRIMLPISSLLHVSH